MSPRSRVRLQRGGDVGVALADLRGDEGVRRIFPRPPAESFFISATQSASALLRRATALKCRSSSWANCFSNVFSRSWNASDMTASVTLAKSVRGDSALPGPLSARSRRLMTVSAGPRNADLVAGSWRRRFSASDVNQSPTRLLPPRSAFALRLVSGRPRRQGPRPGPAKPGRRPCARRRADETGGRRCRARRG